MTKSQQLRQRAADMNALANQYEALEKKESGLLASPNFVVGGVKPVGVVQPVPSVAGHKVPASTPVVPMPMAPGIKMPERKKAEPPPDRKFKKEDLYGLAMGQLTVGEEGALKATDVAYGIGEHKHWVSIALREMAAEPTNAVSTVGTKRATKYYLLVQQ